MRSLPSAPRGWYDLPVLQTETPRLRQEACRAEDNQGRLCRLCPARRYRLKAEVQPAPCSPTHMSSPRSTFLKGAFFLFTGPGPREDPVQGCTGTVTELELVPKSGDSIPRVLSSLLTHPKLQCTGPPQEVPWASSWPGQMFVSRKGRLGL